jgi:hypothetical protein
MWKADGKTTTLLHFLDSLFQKQRQILVIEGKLEGRIEMTGSRGRRHKQMTLRKREDTGN